MSSVAKPTIFDAVNGAWFAEDCQLCKNPIRFGWGPRPGEPHSTWASPLLFRRLCPVCVVGAAVAETGPESDTVLALRQHYKRIESVWHFAGFGDPAEEARPLLRAKQRMVRLALGVRETPTLWLVRWHPRKRHKGSNDPYLELFQITGRLPVMALSDVSYDDFSGYQRFALGDRGVSGQREVLATVKLAINACYPPASPTEIHWRWDPWNPNEETEPIIHRFGSCSNEDLSRLSLHAAGLYFKVPRSSGRTRDVTKSYPPGTENDFLRKVEEVIAEYEKDGRILTTVQMLADAIGMSKSWLYDEMFKRVPEAQARFKEHQQRRSRR